VSTYYRDHHDRQSEEVFVAGQAPQTKPADPRLTSLVGNEAMTELLGGQRYQAHDELPEQGAGPLHGDIQNAIEATADTGAPLGNVVRAEMEGHLGVDLSAVRVHTDAASHALSRSVQAVAFTTGRDIYFSPGSFEPTGTAGRELLAHELAHVVQQAEGRSGPGGEVSDPGDLLEIEAANAARQIAATSVPTAATDQSAETS
jgi:hypothetical protein